MKPEKTIRYTQCGHHVTTPIPFGNVWDSKDARCPNCEAGKIYDLATGEHSTPEQIRARCEQETKGLGKFEGEAAYVVWFYECSLHGDGESECHCDTQEDYEVCNCDSGWSTFDVDDNDQAIFPELKGREKVRIYFRSDGFVCED